MSDFIQFTNLKEIGAWCVEGNFITGYVEDADHAQLKINLCLASQLIIADEQKSSLIFERDFYASADKELIEFIIGHEIGHIVLGHKRSVNRALANEIEADNYSLIFNGISPVKAKTYLKYMYTLADLSSLNDNQLKAAAIMKWFRLTNLSLISFILETKSFIRALNIVRLLSFQ